MARMLRGLMAQSPIAKIELHHMTGGGLRVVRPWTFSEGVEDILKLANDIHEMAREDADGMGEGRVQRYAILAYEQVEEGDGIGGLVGRWNFPVQIDIDMTSLGGIYEDTDPPNERGVLQMLMRHVDAKDKVYTVALGRVLERQEQTIEKLINRLDRADTFFVDVTNTYRNLMTAEDERKAALRRGERNEKLQERAIDKLDNLTSVVMAQLMPPEATAGAGGIRGVRGGSALHALFLSLASNTNAVPGIMGALTLDQKAAFGKLYEQFLQGTLVASSSPEITEGLIRSIMNTLEASQVDTIMPLLTDEGRSHYWALAELYDPSGSLKAAREQAEAEARKAEADAKASKEAAASAALATANGAKP